VNNIIMPIPGALIGGVDFSKFFIALNGQSYSSLDDALAQHAPIIQYGVFINNLINFLIVAWVVFLLVRAINQLRRQAEGAPKEGPKDQECPFCHTLIPIKAIRCPNCTSDLSQVPTTTTV
jgi:large conductance mechanosensitive channel